MIQKRCNLNRTMIYLIFKNLKSSILFKYSNNRDSIVEIKISESTVSRVSRVHK